MQLIIDLFLIASSALFWCLAVFFLPMPIVEIKRIKEDYKIISVLFFVGVMCAVAGYNVWPDGWVITPFITKT